MRKVQLGAAIAVIGFLLAGWARPGGEAAPPDVLILRTGQDLTLVSSLEDQEAIRLPRAVPSIDWSAVVRALRWGTETRVVALDSSSGERLWARDVPGNFEVKVATEHGRLVALGAPRTGYSRGRSITTLVIVGQDTDPRTIELTGNYEPEAFSTDGESLFVVEYVPPRNPTGYRVRRLDLRTEQVVGVYTVDAELQKAMQGTARIQAASPDGRRLYTLYTLQGDDGTSRAFVHVLSLDELWAHCVDLPEAFATRQTAIALSVAPDGRRLYVAETSTATVAEIDTEALAVTRTARVGLSSEGGAAQAAVGPDGVLYLANGTRLLALDPATLSQVNSWETQRRITGIQAASDGRRLYVGLTDRIVILDAAAGGRLGALEPANLGTIRQFGRSTRLLQEERTTLECAC